MATAASLGAPDHALERARLVVAWAHGFVSMELAGAFRLAEMWTGPSTSGSIGSPMGSPEPDVPPQ